MDINIIFKNIVKDGKDINMPYIDKKDRVKFISQCGGINTNTIEELGNIIDNCGELNYVITRICLQYIKKHGQKYQKYNDVIGALEGAKLELYRRHVAPYEDNKFKSNGDVDNAY